MGDVFDRVVSRAAVAPARQPGVGLTTRRGPTFGVPDASEAAQERVSGSMDAGLREAEVERVVGEGDHAFPQTRTVGSETPRDARGSGYRPAGPRSPASPVIAPKPQVGGRDGENEPGPDRGRRLQAVSSTSEPASKPSSLGSQNQEPAPDGPRPAPGPAPREVPADAVRVPADVAIGVEAANARTPGARSPLADLRARPRPPWQDLTAPTPPARTVPADELLREYLAPALVDRGELNAQEAARLTAAEGLGPIGMPAGGDVHVHLGQVVIQQAIHPAPEPPPAASPDAARPDRVDHAHYLARQRRRW